MSYDSVPDQLDFVAAVNIVSGEVGRSGNGGVWIDSELAGGTLNEELAVGVLAVNDIFHLISAGGLGAAEVADVEAGLSRRTNFLEDNSGHLAVGIGNIGHYLSAGNRLDGLAGRLFYGDRNSDDLAGGPLVDGRYYHERRRGIRHLDVVVNGGVSGGITNYQFPVATRDAAGLIVNGLSLIFNNRGDGLLFWITENDLSADVGLDLNSQIVGGTDGDGLGYLFLGGYLAARLLVGLETAPD